MGSTLTHGVYLPDEGERNCYNGLAANWSILDGAVGTIAEHTTALAGKAPAVHTHTKSDITDFPALANVATSGSYNDLSNIPASFTPSSHTHGNLTNDGKIGTTANLPLITGTDGAIQAGAFGTTAGTFCEGNDSRLSDARTPLSHTHTKSDVTDLFNSANKWTASNTYNAANAIIIQNNNVSIGSEPSSYQEQQLKWSDTDGNEIARIKYLNQLTSAGNIANGLEFATTDKFKDGVRDPTGSIISATFRIGLWNDGTKYVYNECRWRSNLLPFGNNTNDIGSSSYQWNNVYSKNYYYNGVAWGLDKANTWTKTQNFVGEYQGTELSANYNTCFGIYGVKDTVGKSGMFFTKYRPNRAQGSLTSSDLIQYGVDVLENEVKTTNVFDLQVSNYNSNTGAFTKIDVISILPNANLGNSTNKWKSLNGVNPGALSLPDLSDPNPIYTGDWVGDNSIGNAYTPTENGWVYLRITGTNKTITIRYGGSGPNSPTQTNESAITHLSVFFPVIAGVTMRIFYKDTIEQAFFYPCLGNV